MVENIKATGGRDFELSPESWHVFGDAVFSAAEYGAYI